MAQPSHAARNALRWSRVRPEACSRSIAMPMPPVLLWCGTGGRTAPARSAVKRGGLDAAAVRRHVALVGGAGVVRRGRPLGGLHGLDRLAWRDDDLELAVLVAAHAHLH